MNAEKMIELVLCRAEPSEREPDDPALPLDSEQAARLNVCGGLSIASLTMAPNSSILRNWAGARLRSSR